MVLWLRTLISAFPAGGMCVNHPDTPGQLRPIPHTPCRNFRAKPYRVEPPEPPNDRIRYIPLTRGLHAIVDAEDYEWLNQYKWYAGAAPGHRTFYARTTRSGGRVLLMHRMIMHPPKGKVVDHINGNGLDNRRCNLRICSQGENAQNRRRHWGRSSRFLGVSRHRDGRWQAKIRHKGHQYYLGLYDDEVEAAKVRDRKARELLGETAYLNFPPESSESDGSSQ
jgi:hypothetical protein